jgi:MYXO-CTERM domain-containing protein
MRTMRRRVRESGRRVIWALLGLGFGFVLTKPAAAEVLQTGTTEVLPKPVRDGERNLVDAAWGWNAQTMLYKDADGQDLAVPIAYGDYYAPPKYPQFVTGDAITLEGMFKWRAEAIDPVEQAKPMTAGLTPHCALAVELVLVGGICEPSLFWYNVPDPSSGTPPSPTEQYELIPLQPLVELSCLSEDGQPRTDGFCPLAWDNRSPRNLSLELWQKKTYTSDLSQDPRYAGGAIAFGIRTGGSIYCPDYVFGLLQHGARNASNQPYVNALVYESTARPGSVYVAFEDSIMAPEDWHSGGKADGDFNDYVVHVAGCFEPSDMGSGGAGAGGAGGAGSDGVGGGGTDAPAEPGGANMGGQSANGTAGDPASTGGISSSGGAGARDSAGGNAEAGSSDAPLANASDSSNDSSCGCRTAPRSGPVPLAAMALALGLGLRRRRSRS